ncbi:MAG: DUF2470 domain-containing protein [Phycisphaerales bacterium]|nr:DUF2470 domain-containing protein [Phycisphaerales bacterium]
MPEHDPREARSILLRSREGALAWSSLGEDRVERVRFVLDPSERVVALPVSAPVVEAESHVLYVPEEGDDALQLLLDLDRERQAPEALVDRWRIHHGDAPRRLPGDFKGEPGKVWWGRFTVDTARLGSAVIDGEALLAPNPLAPIEPRICRRMNADRDALRRVCEAVGGAAPREPLCVGIDEEGVHVRADGGLMRLPFGGAITAPDEAERTLDGWLRSAAARGDGR